MSGWTKIFRKKSLKSLSPAFHIPSPPFLPFPLGTVLHYPHPTGEIAYRWALVVGEPDLNIYPLIVVGFGEDIAAGRILVDEAWHPETQCFSRHSISDFSWSEDRITRPWYPSR